MTKEQTTKLAAFLINIGQASHKQVLVNEGLSMFQALEAGLNYVPRINFVEQALYLVKQDKDLAELYERTITEIMLGLIEL